MEKTNKFKKLLPHNWSIVKVYRDFENFADWKRVVKKEKADPNSRYSKWKLQHTMLYDLFLTITLDDSDIQLPDIIKKAKVLETLIPLNKYLDEDLGFAGSLSIELNQIEDDQKNLTLSYFIVYRFIFEKFSLKWLGKFLLYVGAISFLVIRYDLLSYIRNFFNF